MTYWKKLKYSQFLCGKELDFSVRFQYLQELQLINLTYIVSKFALEQENLFTEIYIK